MALVPPTGTFGLQFNADRQNALYPKAIKTYGYTALSRPCSRCLSNNVHLCPNLNTIKMWIKALQR